MIVDADRVPADDVEWGLLVDGAVLIDHEVGADAGQLAAVRRVDPGRLGPLCRRGAREQTGSFRPFKSFQRVLNRNVQLRFRKHLCIHVAIEKHLDVGGRAVGRPKIQW